MPSSGAPDAPLRLHSGGDRFLVNLRRAMATLAAVAISVSLWPLAARVLGAGSVVLLAALIERRARRRPARRIVLHSDASASIDGAPATLLEDAWLTARYAVLALDCEGRTRRLLISASRQHSGEYRKLLAWMRLRPWTDF